MISKTCGICIARCPHSAFDDEKIIKKTCLAYKDGCSKCLIMCPFHEQDYEKVKKRYERMKR